MHKSIRYMYGYTKPVCVCIYIYTIINTYTETYPNIYPRKSWLVPSFVDSLHMHKKTKHLMNIPNEK